MSRPLTLAFCLMHYFPYGGQQRDFRKIAEHCISQGHRVIALVNAWQDALPADIEVVQFGLHAGSNHRRLEKFADAVHRWRQQHEVDALIGFQKLPGLDCYFAADPCYRDKALQRYRWLAWLQPRFHSLSKLERAVFAPEAQTQILVLTAASQQIYQRSYGTPAERFHLLPAGVTAVFQPPEPGERQRLRQHHGIADDTQLLLMVGSNFMTKGVDRSLRALAALPAAERKRTLLWVAGNGKAARLQTLAKQLAIADQVRFLGGRDDVALLMRAADLLLQPSRTELAGMSIVEALCSGLPVIASGECGYGFHVSAADAGICLPEPFSQADFDAALLAASDIAQQQRWRAAAGHYAQQTPLRQMAERAAERIVAVATAHAQLNALAQRDQPHRS